MAKSTYFYMNYGDFEFGETGYPVPELNIETVSERTPGGDTLSQTKTFELKGQCTGPENNHKILYERASGLHDEVFKNNKRDFAIGASGEDGVFHVLFSGRAFVESLSFNENQNSWSNYIDYNLVLKSDIGNINYSGIKNATDTFSIEALEDKKYRYNGQYQPVYKITRNIGATASTISPETGSLYHAKQWVNRQAEISPLTGLYGTAFQLYNQERNVDLDETAGSYNITDNFIAKSGDPYLEKFDIKIQVNEIGNKKIAINGEIIGLEPATGIYGTTLTNSGISSIYPTNLSADTTREHPQWTDKHDSVKYNNAVRGYEASKQGMQATITFYDNNYSSLEDNNRPINPIPLSVAESFFPFDGKVTYQAEYDTRPLALITGAITEKISYSHKPPSTRVQEITILGRRLGPLVYEYNNSPNVGTLSVSYEGRFPRPTGLGQYDFPQAITNAVESVLNGYNPNTITQGGGQPYFSYLTEDSQQINLHENRLSCKKTWEYTNCK